MEKGGGGVSETRQHQRRTATYVHLLILKPPKFTQFNQLLYSSIPLAKRGPKTHKTRQMPLIEDDLPNLLHESPLVPDDDKLSRFRPPNHLGRVDFRICTIQ